MQFAFALIDDTGSRSMAHILYAAPLSSCGSVVDDDDDLKYGGVGTVVARMRVEGGKGVEGGVKGGETEDGGCVWELVRGQSSKELEGWNAIRRV